MTFQKALPEQFQILRLSRQLSVVSAADFAYRVLKAMQNALANNAGEIIGLRHFMSDGIVIVQLTHFFQT